MWAFYGNFWAKGDTFWGTSYLKAHPLGNRSPEYKIINANNSATLPTQLYFSSPLPPPPPPPPPPSHIPRTPVINNRRDGRTEIQLREEKKVNEAKQKIKRWREGEKKQAGPFKHYSMATKMLLIPRSPLDLDTREAMT
ncbi:hypothetical protein E2C01_074649 [Portunus trituberculatus]|uniref:Uncharacterized protein n=1 Tax=Portunus trituberculatus TaxID=210409 RepID=A0A5B7I8J6_PORTR|nr:hypothetical protein [Portunus trituberculatus]